MERVAPRDIFNEANFMKNLAYLVQAVSNNEIPNARFNGIDLYNTKLLFFVDELNEQWDLTRYQQGQSIFERADDYEPLLISRTINSRSEFSIYFMSEDQGIYDVFDDDGKIDDICHELLGSGPSECVNDQSNEIFARAIFIKCIAKIALDTIPDVNGQHKGFTFNEDFYTENGLAFENEGRYDYLDDQNELVTRGGEPLVFRCPTNTYPDDLWPLEVSNGNDEWVRVYNKQGEFTPAFLDTENPLQKEALETPDSLIHNVQRRTR